MRKLHGILLFVLVALSACTSPSSTPKSLYQGDWDWAAVNANNPNDYVTGIASFSIEVINSNTSSPQYGKKVAGGWYDIDGISIRPAGMALMGPIITPLDMGFSVGSTSQVLMAGIDSDGFMGTNSSGRKVFSGMGRVYGSNGVYIDVAIALVQRDDSPTYSRVTGSLPMSDLASQSRVWELHSSNIQKDAQSIAEKLASLGIKAHGQGELRQLFK
ncbi:hypothetical protein [Meiothermus cerbereus]|uniref:hypothetical protein n=1 Tax=Meiothermus cerbereus TaxID=65552 RepID=UPI003EE9A8E9